MSAEYTLAGLMARSEAQERKREQNMRNADALDDLSAVGRRARERVKAFRNAKNRERDVRAEALVVRHVGKMGAEVVQALVRAEVLTAAKRSSKGKTHRLPAGLHGLHQVVVVNVFHVVTPVKTATVAGA